EVGGGGATGIDITQVLAPDIVGEKPLLPSALYLPETGEAAEGIYSVPWNDARNADPVVGSFARDRAALVPDRVVTSAKSWLCNPHIDRRAAILPWQAELAQGKVSAFEASRLCLQHLREGFEFHQRSQAQAPSLDDCHIVLTVPASFDEVARSLTHEA